MMNSPATEYTAEQVTHTHRPGRHCGSSAIRDLLEFHGLNLTEAFCFGLGAGLGITYVELPSSGTPYIVHVRSMGFEEKVFNTLDIDFQWRSFPNKPLAEEALDQCLSQGRPALLLTDIYHLPYFNSSTRFPGHAIVAWGHAADAQDILVSDTERPDLLSVPRKNLTDARFSLSAPFTHHGNLFAPTQLDINVQPERIRAVIRDNATTLRHGDRNNGLPALLTWIAELPNWQAQAQWPWILRFAYQVIEKRGTGGGGFRTMYAEFLEQVKDILPAVEAEGLPEMMRESASAWSQLAEQLKAGSEAEQFPQEQLQEAIEAVYAAELKYVNAALTQ